MKSIISFSLLIIFSHQLLAQANCINEGTLNSNQVAILNATAAGDTILTSSGIGAEVSLVQPTTPFFGPFNVMSYDNDSIAHTGSFELHASSNCNRHTVTFYSIYEDQLIIDGDTIFTAPVGSSFNYVGTNYTVTKDSSNYTITGDFNVISINTQTNNLANICISCVSNSGSGCINEGTLNSNQVAMLNASAAGDTILTSSGIGAEVSLVQPTSPFFGPFNIMSYSNDSIWHTGSFELHASSNCNNHTVTFYSIYEDQLIIDGDTIFSSPVGSSFNYIGTNYTVDKDSSNYTITGDFNVISINTQTNQLADICISCDNTLSIEDDSILYKNSFQIFPNPAQSFIEISGKYQGVLDVTILDLSGRIFSKYSNLISNSKIDVSDFNSGIYLVLIEGDAGSIQQIEKIIIQ
jgi:preprotein translocase subunit YajC